MIHVEGLKKGYASGPVTTQVLRGVTFAVPAGEIAVVLGPSGSGKTTLLNIVGGIDRADAGRLVVGGLDLCRLGNGALTDYRRENVGYLFQHYNLVPNLTVAENVELVAHISRAPLDGDEVLDAVGMLERKHRFPRELSGGEQQRSSLARAIVKNPKVLLCDEPTGALDYQTSRGMLALIQTVNQRYDTTVLMVTHNTAISTMANRVLRLRDGVIEDESVNEVVAPAQSVQW